MSATHYFLGVGDDVDLLRSWFMECAHPVRYLDRGDDIVFHFNTIAPIDRTAGTDATTVQAHSPLVFLVKPRTVRRVLRTAGQVVFSATPLRSRFPELEAIHRRFRRWLAQHPCVYSQAGGTSSWDYYLEGELRNFAVRVYALPMAFKALHDGQYFVHGEESQYFLDRLCRMLQLRGVDAEILP